MWYEVLLVLVQGSRFCFLFETTTALEGNLCRDIHFAAEVAMRSEWSPFFYMRCKMCTTIKFNILILCSTRAGFSTLHAFLKTTKVPLLNGCLSTKGGRAVACVVPIRSVDFGQMAKTRKVENAQKKAQK